jgi:hypothetical protein
VKLTSVEVTAKMDVRIERPDGVLLTLSAAEVRMAALALRDSLKRMMPVPVPTPDPQGFREAIEKATVIGCPACDGLRSVPVAGRPEVARPCLVCVPCPCERRTHR